MWFLCAGHFTGKLFAPDEGIIDPTLATDGSAVYEEPAGFLELFGASKNDSGWNDAKYIELLERANRETDEAKRHQTLSKNGSPTENSRWIRQSDGCFSLFNRLN